MVYMKDVERGETQAQKRARPRIAPGSLRVNAIVPFACDKARVSTDWMGGRVVEGTGLENRQTRKRLEGSNPSPSAILLRATRFAGLAEGIASGNPSAPRYPSPSIRAPVPISRAEAAQAGR